MKHYVDVFTAEQDVKMISCESRSISYEEPPLNIADEIQGYKQDKKTQQQSKNFTIHYIMDF
jgi:hypothetical protein